MAKKRIVVVGLDHYHTVGWIQSLELFSDRLEVVGIYDPDPSLRASLRPRYQDPHWAPALDDSYRALPYFTDLGELLEVCRPDIALVTLPNRDTPAALTELARAGVHILTDKPGAKHADDLQLAIDVARDNNVKIATGLLRRYGRGWQAAKEMIEAGRTGRLLSTETVFNTSSPWIRDPANPIFSNDLQGGGILMWLGVHDIDLLLWLTGERIVDVQAMSAQVNGAGIDVEDAISVSVRYESGAIGTIHYAYVLPRTLSQGFLAVRGAQGSISMGNDGTLRWIGPGDRSDPVREETISSTSAKMPGYGSLAPLVIADLLGAIEENREPLSNGEEMVHALRVIDAIYEAASTGNRVSVRW
ncbi:MAG: Gfo/Idh/MocA family oxidoreductase [Thermomicrobiales bacterium]|nr:Gfo/Idh/MocA family oxidoreductase [Thermomicrobiales bacterium]